MIVIRKCTIGEVAANAAFPALHREYAAEAALAGLPDPDEKLGAYRLIEPGGAFQAYGAFLVDGPAGGDVLVGVAAVLTPVIPHYGVAIAVTESLFVAAAHRRTGAGVKLIRAAEKHARDAGSPALLVSAPVGGRLVRVLPRLGYRETNRVFLKEVAHG